MPGSDFGPPLSVSISHARSSCFPLPRAAQNWLFPLVEPPRLCFLLKFWFFPLEPSNPRQVPSLTSSRLEFSAPLALLCLVFDFVLVFGLLFFVLLSARAVRSRLNLSSLVYGRSLDGLILVVIVLFLLIYVFVLILVF
jgi:hypothetical protein